MTHQQYKLLFRDIEIGMIRQEDVDFPNVWGTFEPSPATDHPEVRAHVQRYIDYSREADKLILQDDSEWDRFISQNESQFLDLIECDDWWLVDGAEERHPILIPNFCVNGVVWRER